MNLVFGGNRQSGELDVATACNAKAGTRLDFESETFIVGALKSEGADGSPDGTGRGMPIVTFQTRIARNGRGQPKDITDALTGSDGGMHADSKPHVAGPFGVRRLTPCECERLQGFPDDWTLIPTHRKRAKERGADAERLLAYYHRTEYGRAVAEMRAGRVYVTPDAPRYRALGNSFPVPVVRWLGERIQAAAGLRA